MANTYGGHTMGVILWPDDCGVRFSPIAQSEETLFFLQFFRTFKAHHKLFIFFSSNQKLFANFDGGPLRVERAKVRVLDTGRVKQFDISAFYMPFDSKVLSIRVANRYLVDTIYLSTRKAFEMCICRSMSNRHQENFLEGVEFLQWSKLRFFTEVSRLSVHFEHFPDLNNSDVIWF